MLDKESSLKRRFFSLKFLLLLHCKLDIPTLMMVIILLHKKTTLLGILEAKKVDVKFTYYMFVKRLQNCPSKTKKLAFTVNKSN